MFHIKYLKNINIYIPLKVCARLPHKILEIFQMKYLTNINIYIPLKVRARLPHDGRRRGDGDLRDLYGSKPHLHERPHEQDG